MSYPKSQMALKAQTVLFEAHKRRALDILFPDVPGNARAMVRVVGNLRRNIRKAEFRVRVEGGETYSRPLLEVPFELWAREGAVLMDTPEDRRPKTISLAEFLDGVSTDG